MKKIVIVDDDADLRDAVAAVLAGKFEIRQAESKAAARSLFKTYMPDLVILDVMMDSLNSGFELAREIKKRKNPPRILMLTGVDRETNIDFKSEAGDAAWLPVDEYIVKPLVPKVLLEKVGKLLA
jgi:two-component system OmpR family response regulator